MLMPLMSSKLSSEKFIFDGKYLDKIMKIIKIAQPQPCDHTCYGLDRP